MCVTVFQGDVEVCPDCESALLEVWGHCDLQRQQQWDCGLVRQHLTFSKPSSQILQKALLSVLWCNKQVYLIGLWNLVNISLSEFASSQFMLLFCCLSSGTSFTRLPQRNRLELVWSIFTLTQLEWQRWYPQCLTIRASKIRTASWQTPCGPSSLQSGQWWESMVWSWAGTTNML